MTATATGRPGDDEQAQRTLETAEAELTAYRDDERIVGVLGKDRYLEGAARRERGSTPS